MEGLNGTIKGVEVVPAKLGSSGVDTWVLTIHVDGRDPLFPVYVIWTKEDMDRYTRENATKLTHLTGGRCLVKDGSISRVVPRH